MVIETKCHHPWTLQFKSFQCSNLRWALKIRLILCHKVEVHLILNPHISPEMFDLFTNTKLIIIYHYFLGDRKSFSKFVELKCKQMWPSFKAVKNDGRPSPINTSLSRIITFDDKKRHSSVKIIKKLFWKYRIPKTLITSYKTHGHYEIMKLYLEELFLLFDLSCILYGSCTKQKMPNLIKDVNDKKCWILFYAVEMLCWWNTSHLHLLSKNWRVKFWLLANGLNKYVYGATQSCFYLKKNCGVEILKTISVE